MKEIRKKSVLPIYGIAVIWILYALICPMYRIWHFIILIAVSVGVYWGLSKLFPGKVEYVEEPKEPETTGNEIADFVISEGNKALSEFKRLKSDIGVQNVQNRITELYDITDKIIKEIKRCPMRASKVRRFINYYIPTTLKLLNAYNRMDDQGIDGHNISGTKQKIEDMLDTSISAYKKQLDALFADEALDIETDITVMENMMKSEGLSDRDF